MTKRRQFFIEAKGHALEEPCDKCGNWIAQDERRFFNPNPKAKVRGICLACFSAWSEKRRQWFGVTPDEVQKRVNAEWPPGMRDAFALGWTAGQVALVSEAPKTFGTLVAKGAALLDDMARGAFAPQEAPQ